jgi:hypothetical protein
MEFNFYLESLFIGDFMVDWPNIDVLRWEKSNFFAQKSVPFDLVVRFG